MMQLLLGHSHQLHVWKGFFFISKYQLPSCVMRQVPHRECLPLHSYLVQVDPVKEQPRWVRKIKLNLLKTLEWQARVRLFEKVCSFLQRLGQRLKLGFFSHRCQSIPGLREDGAFNANPQDSKLRKLCVPDD